MSLDMNQKQVWNQIAPEWHEFKKLPAESTIEFLKKQKGKILDFGSGSGRHLIKIPNAKIYELDFSQKMIELAKEKAKEKKIESEFVVSSMTKTPYEDNFFDSAICISALHCLKSQDQKKAIKELYRILKPKAKAFIGVWNKNSKRFKKVKTNEKMIGWRDLGKRYYYLFSEAEVHNLFEKAGFEIITTNNSEMMIRFIVEKFK